MMGPRLAKHAHKHMLSQKNKSPAALLVPAFALMQVMLLASFRLDQLPGLAAAPLLVLVIVLVMRDEQRELLRLLSPSSFWILAIAQALTLVALATARYYSLSYNTYDTGLFAHVTANVAAGRGFANHVLQTHAFADHFSPVLALLAPLFWIDPSFLWLPFLKIVGFLSCLPLLWRFTRPHLENLSSRVLVLLLWLTNYPLLKVMTAEFQPSSLSMPFVLLAFIAAQERRSILLPCVLILLLTFKEHMALAWVSLGLWLLVCQHRNRLGIVLVACGIGAGLAVVFGLAPLLSDASSGQLHKFGPLANLGDKILFFAALLGSVGFLPLLAPRTLPLCLAAAAISFVSAVPAMASMEFHHQDLPATIMFVAVVVALSDLEKRQTWLSGIRPAMRALMTTASVCAMLFLNTHRPARSLREHWPSASDLALIDEIKKAQSQLKEDRVVWAQNSLGPYFARWPKLRSVHDVEGPISDPSSKAILVAEGINPWPLGEHSPTLLRRLAESAQRGELTRISGYSRLRIYVTAVPSQ